MDLQHTLRALHDVAGEVSAAPRDWQSHPQRLVTHTEGPVSVSLRGFAVESMTFDAGWFETASRRDVELAASAAMTAALSRMVDEELEAARATRYEDADIQGKPRAALR